MSAQVESSFPGEGMVDNGDIRSWMIEHNIRLLDDTYAKLAENEFRSINDLSAVTVDEMSEYAKDMNIKLPDRSKLKRALEILNNKARIYDPDEINAIKSITLKIKQFENIINKQTNNEEIINKKSEEIQTQINNEFDKIIKKINERRIYLSKTLNDIKNKKITMIKTRSDGYNQSLNMVKKMKTETDILMNKAIEISELNDRKLKIIQNEKNVIKIINDTIEKNKMPINCEINASFDTINLIQFIQKFGMISEGDIVILERLEYDNNNPNGIINVIWKLNKMNNESKDNNNGKLSIEYGIINDDIKHNDIDEKALKCEEINIGNKINGINNIKISDIGMYLFKLKYFSKGIWSQYSEVKRINVMKISNIPRINSAILKDNEKRKLMNMLNKELNRNDGNIKLNLLYRYSRDDKTPKGFHKMCDNKGATVVVVKSKKYNHVFGAYLSVAWTSSSSGSWKKDSNLFLFLLRSSFGHDERVFKLKQRDLPYAVFHNATYHPYIVCNGAIAIQQGDNKSWSYIDTDYLDDVKGNALCGGDSYNETCNKYHYFSVDNYEVFTVKYN